MKHSKYVYAMRPCRDGAPCVGVQCSVHEDCSGVVYPKPQRSALIDLPVQLDPSSIPQKVDIRSERRRSMSSIAVVVVTLVVGFWLGYIAGGDPAATDTSKAQIVEYEKQIQTLEEHNKELHWLLDNE
jgi:hypothetical protein